MPKKLFVIQILTMTVMVAVILVAQPAFAGLYKWVDDQGKVHFTDDKAKIPKKYRTDTQMKRLHSIASPKETPSTGSSSGSSKGDKGGEGMDAASLSAEDKEGILEEAEEKAVEEVIAFFEKENDRADGFDGVHNTIMNYNIMNQGFKNFLPIKKGFVKKFSKSKIPALKETHDYLKKSIKEDEVQIATAFQSGASRRGYYRRIVSEIPIKEELKKKLLAAVEKSKKKKEELKKAEEAMKQAEAEKEKKKATAKK